MVRWLTAARCLSALHDREFQCKVDTLTSHTHFKNSLSPLTLLSASPHYHHLTTTTTLRSPDNNMMNIDRSFPLMIARCMSHSNPCPTVAQVMKERREKRRRD